jgi:imidazole glycerol-phosphate synthase subunit HisF
MVFMPKKFIRIIPKLDIKNGILIKGINLEGLRVLGDPYKFANHYYKNGADEIYYVDSVASLYGTNNLKKFISKTAKNLFVPLSVGGGIRTMGDIENFLKFGADKICINSAAIKNLKFVKEASRIFGSSTITCIIETVKYQKQYFITKESGRDSIKISPVDWAKKLEDAGAGEIFLTSVNNEGLKKGFDINISEKVSKSVRIPVVAHGGAGSFKDVYKVIKETNISGVSIASLFHYDICSLFSFKSPKIGNDEFLKNQKRKKSNGMLKKLKNYLRKKGVLVRL